jgi:hypothetical protein
MTGKIIVDAGPALNFFSINKERVLLSVVGPISAPEVVLAEVKRKARRDRRFRAAPAVWAKLARAQYLEVLSDDVTPALAAAVQRISNVPMERRYQQAKDLGEVMVVAHAAVHAAEGDTVTVIIDDGPGAQLARAESARLQRLRQQGKAAGSIVLVNTPTILVSAARGQYIPDRDTMRAIYKQLRGCDDGLVDISQTDLLSPEVWAPKP